MSANLVQRLRPWMVLASFAAYSGCAALASWDDFAGGDGDAGGGDANNNNNDGGSNDGADTGRDSNNAPDALGPIVSIQSNAAAFTTAKPTVDVTFTKAQIAGDLNVVAIGWYDSDKVVTSVKDTSLNTYTVAVERVTTTTGGWTATHTIWFAPNINAAPANANVVTVTWSGGGAPGASDPDVRIVEFAGLDRTNPRGVTASDAGGAAPAIASATTLIDRGLVFGGGIVNNANFAAPTAPDVDGAISSETNIVVWRVVDKKGTYSVTAPLDSQTDLAWIMQLVSFH